MEKRARGTNFSESEKQLLISIISDCFSQIENKRTDGISLKEKHSTWLRVAEAFNAANGCGPRSAMQLKTAYFNFKIKIKKDNANDKAELYKTGGGPAVQPKMDEAKLKLLELLKPQLDPVDSIFDSSANYLASINESQNLPNTEEILHFMEPTDIPVVNISDEPSCSKITEVHSTVSNNNAKNLKKKKRTVADVYEGINDLTEKKKKN